MSNVMYNAAKGSLNANDWTSGTWKVLLTTSSYAINIDTHVFVSAVTNELSGGSYVRKTLTTSRTVDNTNDRCDYLADNVTWTAVTAAAGAPAYAIVFKFVTNDADSLLICQLDAVATFNGGDFTIKFDGQASNGTVFRLT